MKITAVTTQKNDGANPLDSMTLHQSIGFIDILILSNDCEDGSDEMLDHLSKAGEIIHLRNDGPYDDRGNQFAALKLADRQKAVKEADWIMHLDIDDFLNIHVGDGQIADLIAALPKADAIALTWLMFGNNEIIENKDRLITDQFAGAAPKMCESAKDVFVFYDADRPENALQVTLFQGDNVTHLRSTVKSVDPAEIFQATRFLPAVAALTSENP